MKRRISLLSGKGLKRFLATYRASGNLRSAYLLNCSKQQVVSLKVPGAARDLRIRTGTSDALFLREALLNGFDFREYQVPVAITPRTILDIGANSGIVSLILKQKYPAARLFAFEPMPENYALLEYNLRGFEEVLTLPFGLGKETTEKEYFDSDDPRNLGGGTFYPTASQVDKGRGKLRIVSCTEALNKYDIRDIDLIKIDTEGAEYEILTSFPAKVISRVTAIVGELHGIKDQALLDYLSQWFDIDHTPTKGRLSLFKAVNKQAREGTQLQVPEAAAVQIG